MNNKLKSILELLGIVCPSLNIIGMVICWILCLYYNNPEPCRYIIGTQLFLLIIQFASMYYLIKNKKL